MKFEWKLWIALLIGLLVFAFVSDSAAAFDSAAEEENKKDKTDSEVVKVSEGEAREMLVLLAHANSALLAVDQLEDEVLRFKGIAEANVQRTTRAYIDRLKTLRLQYKQGDECDLSIEMSWVCKEEDNAKTGK